MLKININMERTSIQEVNNESVFVQHSKVKEMMLFVAVITSKAHFFAVVICLPILVEVNFPEVTDYEIGTLIAVQTAGAIIANKYAESCISACGLWVSLNIGFLVLLSA